MFGWISEEKSKDMPVPTPALNLTKVILALGTLLTGAITLLTTWIDKQLDPSGNPGPTFNTTEVTTIIVALIGFFAIVGSADMIARGIACSAKQLGSSSIAAAGSKARILRLPQAISAQLTRVPPGAEGTPRTDRVRVVAIKITEPPEYLCLHGDDNASLSWHSNDHLKFD